MCAIWVRISDARMSGTSYGTCVLHVSPESHLGGPLALVRTGDEIELDTAQRRIHWHVKPTTRSLGAVQFGSHRRSSWRRRAYQALFVQHVTQAHQGCDFDFLSEARRTASRIFFE